MDKNHRPVLPMSSFPLLPTRLVRRGHGTARSARHGTPQNWLDYHSTLGVPPCHNCHSMAYSMAGAPGPGQLLCELRD
jgi:hypothetical protein